MLDNPITSHAPFDREFDRYRDTLQKLLTAQVLKLQPAWAAFIPPHRVEDEVAELQLAILSSKKTYDPTRCFRAWAMGVASRRLADRKRQFYRERARRTVRSQSSFEAAETFDALVGAVAAREEPDPVDWRVPLLRAELARLPENERVAVERRFFDGAEYPALASALGVTPATARGLVSRGLRRLSQRLRVALCQDGSG